ncbi:hypothetical protein CK203_092265 [Vitis vinifera]|uniref:DUF4283 domain-containing protein n=1 Tax=Vitis vinifera TaxID=29760 RepID=A0A438F883_VITVI|nr:hypothetical protein CK203_092265 [Vitis vinifera]
MRGGKRWFAIESKTFEVSVEEVKGKIRGTIVERSRGLSSWIRFGVTSLRKFLEGGWTCFAEKLQDLEEVTQEEVKLEEALRVGQNFGEEQGEFFSGNFAFSGDDYYYALQLWWERLPWLSKVVSMKKKKRSEKEKAREEREVGSRAESSSSKGKEIWRVVEVVGADLVRKAGGKKSLMETGRLVQLKLFQLWGRRMV